MIALGGSTECRAPETCVHIQSVHHLSDWREAS